MSEEFFKTEYLAKSVRRKHLPTDLKVVTGGRGNGKTAELIKLAYDELLYIVVVDERRARFLFEQAHEMGYDILYPLTPRECESIFTPYGRDRGRYNPNNPYVLSGKGIIVDDAQDILSEILGCRVRGMSVNVMDDDITELHDEHEWEVRAKVYGLDQNDER